MIKRNKFKARPQNFPAEQRAQILDRIFTDHAATYAGLALQEAQELAEEQRRRQRHS